MYLVVFGKVFFVYFWFEWIYMFIFELVFGRSGYFYVCFRFFLFRFLEREGVFSIRLSMFFKVLLNFKDIVSFKK